MTRIAEATSSAADDLAFASIEAMAAALAARDVSAAELTELHLRRIDRWDERLQAFVEVFAEGAQAAARAADGLRAAGKVLGPLHGVPFVMKDLYDYAGHPTAVGSRMRPASVAAASASAVRRLEAAGMIALGKTQTVEFAYGGWGTNPVLGTPRNPWDLGAHRVPGGSSSGSAVAVAAGLAPAGLGSDTGGSLRIPAAFCGIVGLKTSQGLIGRGGIFPLALSHDVAGPLTRSVRDAALLLEAMAGFDEADPSTRQAPAVAPLAEIERGIRGLRIARLEEPELAPLTAEVRAPLEAALVDLAALGASVQALRLPRPMAEYLREAGELMSAESYAGLAPFVDPEDSTVGPAVRRRILQGRSTSLGAYLALLQRRAADQAAFLAALDRLDALVAPVTQAPAIPVAEVDEEAAPARYGRFVNWLDLASLALPTGLTPAGLPVGMQIIVRRFDDPLALRIGRAFERHRGGLVHRPPGL